MVVPNVHRSERILWRLDPDDVWRFHRSLTKPFFSRDRVTDFDLIARHTEKMSSVIEKLAIRSSHDRAFDFQEVAGRLTADVGVNFLFGHELVCIPVVERGKRCR
jgi:cytochrome P450